MPANGFKFDIRQSGISVHEAIDKDNQSNLYAIGVKIINLARLEGGSRMLILRRPITQSKLIILTPI